MNHAEDRFAQAVAAALQPLVDEIKQLKARVDEIERVAAMEWQPWDAEARPPVEPAAG